MGYFDRYREWKLYAPAERVAFVEIAVLCGVMGLAFIIFTHFDARWSFLIWVLCATAVALAPLVAAVRWAIRRWRS